MKLVYPACFVPLDEQNGYCVTVPDLPGCVTQGSDLANAIEMAIDAASGWVLDELDDGKSPPKASKSSEIIVEKEGFVNLIMLDIDSYAEKHGDKAVRKNCTIPAWMNTLAEREGVNFSALLQRALTEELFSKSPTPTPPRWRY